MSNIIGQTVADTGVGANMENLTNMSTTEIPPQDSAIMLLVMAVSKYTTFKIGMALHRYYLPVVVVTGLVGNILSLAVMVKSHNRRISCCVYMAALAVTDSCSLLMGGYYWLCTDAPPPVGRPKDE